MSPYAISYCSTEFPLQTDTTMRSSSVRSKSPFARRRKSQRSNDLIDQSEIAFEERKRSFLEDPGLLETSAIEVVLETPPSTPPRKKAPTPVAAAMPKDDKQRSPDLTAASSSSEHSPPPLEMKREDLKRKSFKQKFMQSKKTIAKETTTNTTTCTNSTARTNSRADDEDDRNPIETSRRCFPFSVHTGALDKSRGRSLSRGRNSSSNNNSESTEDNKNHRATTPIRRRARSMSRRRKASVPPTLKNSATSTPAPFCKLRSRSHPRTPLIDPSMRASTEDMDLKHTNGEYESPDPKIEEKLYLRPRLLSRLEGHGSSHTPDPLSPRQQQHKAQEHQSHHQQQQQQQPQDQLKTPRHITLARQKSIFSEVSTPSAIDGKQHPVVSRMEQSLQEATKNGKKIDRMLVYQTLFQIADSLESPEEQQAMQRELALLMQSQEIAPTPVATAAAAPVPRDTFSPRLSENLGPAFSPVGGARSASRVNIKGNTSNINNNKGDEVSDDGFTAWAEDLESESSESVSRASTDTMQFLTDMFNFGSFFSQEADDPDMRDEEDEGEDDEEDNLDQVPESWNNFKPPLGVVPPKPTSRGARRRSSSQKRRTSKGAVALSDTESDVQQRRPRRLAKPRRDTSPNRQAWWRKKGGEPAETRERVRSLLQEEDNLSLSSIDSQQYKATTTSPSRQVIHPPRMLVESPESSPRRRGIRPSRVQADESPVREVTINVNSRQRSKSVDPRRRMLT